MSCKYLVWEEPLWLLLISDVDAFWGAVCGWQPQLFLFTGRRIILPKQHKFLRWGCCNGTVVWGLDTALGLKLLVLFQVRYAWSHPGIKSFLIFCGKLLWDTEYLQLLSGCATWTKYCSLSHILLLQVMPFFFLQNYPNSFYAEPLFLPSSLMPWVIAKLHVRNPTQSKKLCCIC